MTPHPQLGVAAAYATLVAAQTTPPTTCEPQSRLRMHEEKLWDRLAALQETAFVLEARLEPVLHYPEPQTAGPEKCEPTSYVCELDAVFGRALDQIEGITCTLSRIHDRLCL